MPGALFSHVLTYAAWSLADSIIGDISSAQSESSWPRIPKQNSRVSRRMTVIHTVSDEVTPWQHCFRPQNMYHAHARPLVRHLPHQPQFFSAACLAGLPLQGDAQGSPFPGPAASCVPRRDRKDHGPAASHSEPQGSGQGKKTEQFGAASFLECGAR